MVPALTACRSDRSRFPAQGDLFPVVPLPDLQDKLLPVLSPGIPNVINFWASWCQPCRAEMPALQKLSESYGQAELRVIGVAVDDDRDLVREFLLKHAIGFTQLIDRDRKLSKDLLNITAIPVTYLVGRDGKIERVVAGGVDWNRLEVRRMIEDALAIKPMGPT